MCGVRWHNSFKLINVPRKMHSMCFHIVEVLFFFASLLENSSEPQAVKSDSHNCDVIMQRHVYDSLIVARKARNYMSAAKCANIIERKFALAGDLLERGPSSRHV